MRASGRGGRQGPRGDPVPPRALLAFMGMCAQTTLSRVYGASMRAGPLPRSGACCARARSAFGGAVSCMRVSSVFWGIMNGYESAFAITSP